MGFINVCILDLRNLRPREIKQLICDYLTLDPKLKQQVLSLFSQKILTLKPHLFAVFLKCDTFPDTNLYSYYG